MEGDFIKINKALLPLSWCYGLGVRFRNMLFDMGVLKSQAFSVPIISVGNITVGGTGKTPHVEFLLNQLLGLGKVAVLSRGYKRSTRGFVLADSTSTARTIGDEPFQVKRKFPNAIVAVDSDRVRGINQLLQTNPDIDVILLDDAFQHRYVKPGINILLVDYHRLIIYDRLLPAGRMREPLNGKNRADIVIVTKCPKELKPMEYRVITRAMNLFPYQTLYFSTLEYGELHPVFPQVRSNVTSSQLSNYNVLLLTGIASPRQLMEDLKSQVKSITPMTFADHHNFTHKDLQRLSATFEAMPSPTVIITPEKDATRLNAAEELGDELRKAFYVIPVNIKFMLEQEDLFNQNIIGYVRKNSRNSILAKAKDVHQSKDSHHSGDRPRTISFRNN